MVRGIIALGHEPPFVPCAEIAVVEGDLVVVQEVCGTSAAGIGQCRFGYDGVSFKVRHAQIQLCSNAVPHLADKPAERLVGTLQADLHLAYVS